MVRGAKDCRNKEEKEDKENKNPVLELKMANFDKS